MRVNTETTRRDRLAMFVGTILVVVGMGTLAVEGALFGFSHPLVVIGAALGTVFGAVIARNPYLTQLF